MTIEVNSNRIDSLPLTWQQLCVVRWALGNSNIKFYSVIIPGNWMTIIISSDCVQWPSFRTTVGLPWFGRLNIYCYDYVVGFLFNCACVCSHWIRNRHNRGNGAEQTYKSKQKRLFGWRKKDKNDDYTFVCIENAISGTEIGKKCCLFQRKSERSIKKNWNNLKTRLRYMMFVLGYMLNNQQFIPMIRCVCAFRCCL